MHAARPAAFGPSLFEIAFAVRWEGGNESSKKLISSDVPIRDDADDLDDENDSIH